MKVSKKLFNEFKAECQLWVDKLGLKQYTIHYEHKKIHDSEYARIDTNEGDKLSIVTLNTEATKEELANLDVKSIARHEIFHLLTNRLLWLGGSRYIESCDLQEEWEAVTTRLENLFK